MTRAAPIHDDGPRLGGLDAGQHGDRRCAAVWRHLGLRDPGALRDLVRDLLAPVPVVIRDGAGRPDRLSVCPRLCSLRKHIQQRWLALMHIPAGLSTHQARTQVQAVVAAVTPHVVADRTTASLLESLARLHRIQYTPTDTNDTIPDAVAGLYPGRRWRVRPRPPVSDANDDVVPDSVAVDASDPSPPLSPDDEQRLTALCRYLQGASSASSPPCISWLQTGSDIVAAVAFHRLDLVAADAAALDAFVRAFVDVCVGYDRLCRFYESCLVPVLAALTGPASRQLFTLLQDVAVAHPRALVHGLVRPLVAQGRLRGAQVELVQRVAQAALSPADRLGVVQQAAAVPHWTPDLVRVVHALLTLGVGAVPEPVAAALVVKIQAAAADADLCRSAKFPGLIITIATKYGDQFVPWQAALHDACDRLPNLLKKVAMKSVQNMTAMIKAS